MRSHTSAIIVHARDYFGAQENHVHVITRKLRARDYFGAQENHEITNLPEIAA